MFEGHAGVRILQLPPPQSAISPASLAGAPWTSWPHGIYRPPGTPGKWMGVLGQRTFYLFWGYRELWREATLQLVLLLFGLLLTVSLNMAILLLFSFAGPTWEPWPERRIRRPGPSGDHPASSTQPRPSPLSMSTNCPCLSPCQGPRGPQGLTGPPGKAGRRVSASCWVLGVGGRQGLGCGNHVTLPPVVP